MIDVSIPFPDSEKNDFTFIDLFAGIGGFRIALQDIGGRCVFSSENNTYAQQTYALNFGKIPYGDITKKEVQESMPNDFDLLCAGFPCQAFSIAGYRKGFADTRGVLFFEIADIIKKHRPKAILLENVKNLFYHDKGKTFNVILDVLQRELKYKTTYRILNPVQTQVTNATLGGEQMQLKFYQKRGREPPLSD